MIVAPGMEWHISGRRFFFFCWSPAHACDDRRGNRNPLMVSGQSTPRPQRRIEMEFSRNRAGGVTVGEKREERSLWASLSNQDIYRNAHTVLIHHWYSALFRYQSILYNYNL